MNASLEHLDGQISEREKWHNEAAAALNQLKAERDVLKADTSLEGRGARQSRIEDLEALIKATSYGTLGKVGIPIDLVPMLQPLVGRPSPATLTEQIEQLRARRDAAVSEPPDPSAIAGRFRFVGRGKHYVPGPDGALRRVAQNELVELTHDQAAAFADKFERVEEAAASS